MENTNQGMKHGGTCNCMGCQINEFRAHHMGYRLARKVFLVLVILIAFWFGTKYGEIKAFEYQGRSSRMMQQGYTQPMMLNLQPGSTVGR